MPKKWSVAKWTGITYSHLGTFVHQSNTLINYDNNKLME